MDWYPLWNSLRIAAISTVVIFFAGIFAAYYIAKLPRLVKGVLDVLLTLPLVLPPTVVGYLLLRVFGPKRVIGAWVLETFGVKMVMTWWSAIFATVVGIFPLMYRTVRGAFESFAETLAYSGQTLGLSNTYIFWRIRMPYCRQGVLAGTHPARPRRSPPRSISSGRRTTMCWRRSGSWSILRSPPSCCWRSTCSSGVTSSRMRARRGGREDEFVCRY